MKCSSGKTAWQWIVDHSARHGTLVDPGALTVADLEAACGSGALVAARRYCERRGIKAQFGPSYPYAGGTQSIQEWIDEQPGWSAEGKAKYLDYWLLNYSGDQRAHYVRAPGEERPADRICMHYPCVG